MIVSIRGTNGSGKSTAVRFFLDRIGGMDALTPYYVDGRRQPLYYLCPKHRFGILGHYETQCGGTDTLKSYDQLVELAIGMSRGGFNCLLEGVLISGDTKQFLRMYEVIKDIRIVYLTTTLEQCIKNIQHRRNERVRKGPPKPLNTRNTESKFHLTESTRIKLSAAGIYCRRAPVEQAAEIIHDWLVVNRPNGSSTAEAWGLHGRTREGHLYRGAES